MRKCPICKTEYNDGGDRWKKVCYDCYKNYKFLFSAYEKATPIKRFGYKADVYLSHPSVTKEQMDAWIKEKGLEHGWGCEEFDPKTAFSKYKIWVNSTNFD